MVRRWHHKYEFYEPGHFSSGFVVLKLILLFTARCLSVHPSMKNLAWSWSYQNIISLNLFNAGIQLSYWLQMVTWLWTTNQNAWNSSLSKFTLKFFMASGPGQVKAFELKPCRRVTKTLASQNILSFREKILCIRWLFVNCEYEINPNDTCLSNWLKSNIHFCNSSLQRATTRCVQ